MTDHTTKELRELVRYGFPFRRELYRRLFTKRCTRCHEDKPKALFSNDKGKSDGLDSHCQKCRAKSKHLKSLGPSCVDQHAESPGLNELLAVI